MGSPERQQNISEQGCDMRESFPKKKKRLSSTLNSIKKNNKKTLLRLKTQICSLEVVQLMDALVLYSAMFIFDMEGDKCFYYKHFYSPSVLISDFV